MTHQTKLNSPHTLRSEVTAVIRIRRHRRATACAGSAIDHDIHSGVESCHTCGQQLEPPVNGD